MLISLGTQTDRLVLVVKNCEKQSMLNCIFIDREAREIMYLVASVRPFVCLCVLSCPNRSVCLCACNQWAYADNRADAIDRLLIFNRIWFYMSIHSSNYIVFTHGTCHILFPQILLNTKFS